MSWWKDLLPVGIPTLPNQPPKPQIEGHEAEGEKKDNASSSRLVQQDVPDFYCEKHLFFFFRLRVEYDAPFARMH